MAENGSALMTQLKSSVETELLDPMSSFTQWEQEMLGNQCFQSLRVAGGQGMFLGISFRYAVIGRFLDIFSDLIYFHSGYRLE